MSILAGFGVILGVFWALFGGVLSCFGVRLLVLTCLGCSRMVFARFCVWCLLGCLLHAFGSPRAPVGSLFGFLLLPLGCERSARASAASKAREAMTGDGGQQRATKRLLP